MRTPSVSVRGFSPGDGRQGGEVTIGNDDFGDSTKLVAERPLAPRGIRTNFVQPQPAFGDSVDDTDPQHLRVESSFLFDGEQKLVYRGQFDSSRPKAALPVSGEDLRQALDAVLAGRTLPEKQIPSIGCNIKWKAGEEPVYFDPKGVPR